jgi:hypothetical protein
MNKPLARIRTFLLLLPVTLLLAACDDEEPPGYLKVSPSATTLVAGVGESDRREITVTNKWRKQAKVTLPTLPADLAWEGASNTCGAFLAPGASCSATLVFTPTDAYLKEYVVEVDDPDHADDPAFELTLDSRPQSWSGVRYMHDEGPAEGSVVARDAAGNVYLAGKTRAMSADSNQVVQGLFVTRYNRDGSRGWTKILHAGSERSIWPPEEMVAGNGQVCFTHPLWYRRSLTLVEVSTVLRCLQADSGKVNWSHELAAPDANWRQRSALAMATNGDLLVGDSQGTDDAPALHLYRYSPTGKLQWKRSYGGAMAVVGLAATSSGFALAAAARGDVFDLGLADGSYNGVVARLTNDGTPLWATEVGRVLPEESLDMIAGIAVAADDTVYTTVARTEDDPEKLAAAAMLQVRLVSVSGDGNTRWTTTLPLTGTGGFGYSVAVSDDGQRVFVGGVVLQGTSTIDALPGLEGPGQGGGLLAAYDASGVLDRIDMLWTADDGWVVVSDVGVMPDGGLLAAGSTSRYHLDGSNLPAGILPKPSGEIPKAAFVARYPPDGMVD